MSRAPLLIFADGFWQVVGGGIIIYLFFKKKKKEKGLVDEKHTKNKFRKQKKGILGMICRS